MKYFIYTRKSTDSEERQVLSIESQISELKEFAAKENLKSSPRLARQKLPKNLAELCSAKCLLGLKRAKPKEFWLGYWLKSFLSSVRANYFQETF